MHRYMLVHLLLYFGDADMSSLRLGEQFADDPFQKKTAAILQKAADEVEQCSERQRACFA